MRLVHCLPWDKYKVFNTWSISFSCFEKIIIKQLWQIWMSTSNKDNHCILLTFEKDIVNLGFASVDNVYLRVTIWSITLSTICYLYNEVYDNRMKESFPPKVRMTKLTNNKWKCEGQNSMDHSFNIITNV